MAYHFSPPTFHPSTEAPVPLILVDAMRCWRQARDNEDIVQPCLSRTLAPHDCELMVPALESLCLFYEAALGRPISVGGAQELSDDETRLICLVAGEKLQTSVDCPDDAAHVLGCALCSVRAMLAQH